MCTGAAKGLLLTTAVLRAVRVNPPAAVVVQSEAQAAVAPKTEAAPPVEKAQDIQPVATRYSHTSITGPLYNRKT